MLLIKSHPIHFKKSPPISKQNKFQMTSVCFTAGNAGGGIGGSGGGGVGGDRSDLHHGELSLRPASAHNMSLKPKIPGLLPQSALSSTVSTLFFLTHFFLTQSFLTRSLAFILQDFMYLTLISLFSFILVRFYFPVSSFSTVSA
jgi:hypothetical protein